LQDIKEAFSLLPRFLRGYLHFQAFKILTGHFWYGKNSSEIKTECYRAGGGRFGGDGFNGSYSDPCMVL